MSSLLCPPDRDPLRDPLSRIEVPPCSFRVDGGTGTKEITFPASTVAPSRIKELRGQRNALGLYCTQRGGVREGAYLAAYLGPVEDSVYARLLLVTGHGTHVQKGREFFFNGAYEGPDFSFPASDVVRWDLLSYLRIPLRQGPDPEKTISGVGNMINDYGNSGLEAPNCVGVVKKVAGLWLPHAATGELVEVPEIILFKAARDIRYGEEILRSFGDVYRRAYIETPTYRRDVVISEPYPSREGAAEALLRYTRRSQTAAPQDATAASAPPASGGGDSPDRSSKRPCTARTRSTAAGRPAGDERGSSGGRLRG